MCEGWRKMEKRSWVKGKIKRNEKKNDKCVGVGSFENNAYDFLAESKREIGKMLGASTLAAPDAFDAAVFLQGRG